MCCFEGKIYAAPCVANVLLVYDPATERLSGVDILEFASMTWEKFHGICGLDGMIYAVPGSGTKLLEFDTTSGKTTGIDISHVASEGITKFTGACICSGKLFSAPCISNKMLVFDPKTREVSGVDVTAFALEGNKFSDICTFKGKVYLCPSDAECLLVYDVSNEQFQAFDVLKFAPGIGRFGGICVFKGLIYMSPAGASCVLCFHPGHETFLSISLTFLLSKPSAGFSSICEAEGKLYLAGRRQSFMLVLGDFDPWEHVEQLESQEAVPPEVLAEAQAKRRNASLNLGISLQYLLSGFIEEALGPDETGEATKFYDIAKTFACGERSPGFRQICPRDGLPHCSLVDALRLREGNGKATHFLSWCWGYTLACMRSALQIWSESHHELRTNGTFLWICFFCNNQDRILLQNVQTGSDDLEETFKSRLLGIGRALVLLDDGLTPFYISGFVDHLLIILVISVAAAGPMHGAQTKCSRLEFGGEEFRLWMQQRVTAPGRRLEGEQCLRSAAQFWSFIEGTLGGLRCYFLVCAGCEGGSALLGFFCFDFNFGMGCLCVLEGCGGSLKETGDFEQAELFVLPLGGQIEIDDVPMDFDFPDRPLGDPPDPGGGLGVLGRCGCWRPAWPHGLRGVRVGEASHPGPGGGSAHRRHERKMQQALVAIIEMLLAVIGGIAGDDNPAKHQVAGIRGLLEVLREEPEEDDDEDDFQHFRGDRSPSTPSRRSRLSRPRGP